MKRVIATLAVTLAVAAAGAGSAFAATPVESSTQSATTDQAALAASDAVQVDPSNENLVVRVLSPGSDGTVTQTNNAASSATAGNTATTTQSAAQTQASACGCLVAPTAMTDAAQNGDPNGVLAAATQPATATTATPAPAAQPGVQSSGQTASTDQTAAAASSAVQVEPSNQNIDVRVLSPGNDGNVSQTNTAASSATSGNTGTTTQTATQNQGGGSGVQSSTQHGDTDQESAALSEAKQIDPSNSNVSVRVLSPGNDGNVSQTNTAASSATSGNTGTTTQSATQNGSGSSCGCDGKAGVQASDQKADTDQESLAASKAVQVDPSNGSASVRIGSWGNGGNVSQTNTAASSATSGNTGTTTQTATQNQGGGSGVQSSTQHGDTDQESAALSEAKQIDPSNSNVSVRVLSPGNDGNVTQTNNAASSATSGNTATTTQGATQNESAVLCGCHGDGTQASIQSAHADQNSLAASKAVQIDPSNSNEPIGIGGPSKDGHDGCGCRGDSREPLLPSPVATGGNVTQTNNAASSATSGNTATTTQAATQKQSGAGVQSTDQTACTCQGSVAVSKAVQIDPSNSNEPIGIGGPSEDGHDGCGCRGDSREPLLLSPVATGGNVTQTNNAASSATSGNTATTTQAATQNGSGSPCGCDGRTPVQASGQSAHTDQGSLAASAAVQVDPSNSNDPVRIGSRGSDGNVSQTNNAASSATSGNTATTTQTGTQNQAGSDVQATAQDASTGQLAGAFSLAKQIGASNDNEPVRVWSPGNGGNVSQTNSAASSATSGNTGTTTQTAAQSQSGSRCGCSGLGVQAAGQKADTDQGALAASAALQLAGRSPCGCGSAGGNSNDPVSIWSPGNDGNVAQTNSAASSAQAGNTATASQSAGQAQGAGCGCFGSAPRVEALGQQADTHQGALGLSLALQHAPANAGDPTRIWSSGGGGSASQSNSGASAGTAGNTARTAQTGTALMV